MESESSGEDGPLCMQRVGSGSNSLQPPTGPPARALKAGVYLSVAQQGSPGTTRILGCPSGCWRKRSRHWQSCRRLSRYTPGRPSKQLGPACGKAGGGQAGPLTGGAREHIPEIPRSRGRVQRGGGLTTQPCLSSDTRDQESGAADSQALVPGHIGRQA